MKMLAYKASSTPTPHQRVQRLHVETVARWAHRDADQYPSEPPNGELPPPPAQIEAKRAHGVHGKDAAAALYLCSYGGNTHRLSDK